MNTAERLPDLPGLERVEVSLINGFSFVPIVLCLGFAGLPTAFLCWFLSHYWRFISDGGAAVPGIFGLAAFLALDVWLLFRLLWGEHSWRTDSEGLTSRSLLRKRYVRWAEVQWCRQTGNDKLTTIGYRVRSPQAQIKISGHTYPCSFLMASIRQHLQRHGMADDLTVPESVISLWDRIPDTVAREIEWRNPHPPRLRLIGALSVLVSVAAALDLALILWVRSDLPCIALLYLVMGVLAGWTGFRSSRIRALWTRMTDSGIEARSALGATEIAWADVSSAIWVDAGLQIRSGSGSFVVPYQSLKPNAENGRLILAIIRRLRETGKGRLLTIPTDLRLHETEECKGETPDSADVRLTASEQWLLTGIVAFIGAMFTAVCASDQRVNPIVAPLLAVGFALAIGLVYAANRTYAFRADSDGVEKRCLCWKRSVPWSKVADHRVQSVRQHSIPTRWLLLDEKGRKLFNAQPDCGTTEARQCFRSLVDKKLSEILPPELYAKPWLARPFNSEDQ